MSKNYAGVEDLLCEESFLSWYFRTDPACIRQWESWIAEDSSHRARAEQAAGFLRSLRLQEKDWSPGRITLSESRLLQKIREAEKKITASAPAMVARKQGAVPLYRRAWVAAASVVLLIAGLSSVYYLKGRNTVLHTAYGEIRESNLPDGTEVTVNADSKVIYSTGWKDGKDREVWLEGEAFFHVSKTPLKSRFIVHTDHFDVIVTGTRFNVVNRPDKANIMLREGSVILRAAGGIQSGSALKMMPGDFVEYYRGGLRKKQANTDSILAWKEHRLIFENTPLRELVRIIREHYGISLQLANEGIADKTISGILPNDNLDVLLRALEATSDFDVVREGDHILIREHP
jgi:transmembrane sensor